MKKYKNIDIKEQELEDLVRRMPEHIEDGLKYVDHQKWTDKGRLDVLLVDSGNSLVICELKVIEDDNMLMQGVDYYDYITQNLEGFSRAYNSNEISIDPKQEPRLFLIAPSFSISLQNRCKWIDIPISLFTYQCIAFENQPDELIPVFKEITVSAKPETIEIYTLEQRLKYITNNQVRKNAEKILTEIKNWDIDKTLIEPTKYDISLKVSGRVFSYIAPRRNHFLMYTYDSEGAWKGFRIDNQEDLDGTLPIVRMNFEKYKK